MARLQPLFQCDKCGELEFVLFDGYCFGDRLLEGVMFRGYKDGHIEVTDEAKVYFADLNQKKWLAEAKQFFATLDIGQCPKCKDDCDVWESR